LQGNLSNEQRFGVERDGEELGLHGRISNTPAALLSHEARWDGEGCLLEARAEVRESRVFGANLVLRRTISARVGEACVRIEDIVCNEGHSTEPLMLLYHINLGWPLLDASARLVGPGEPPEPRDIEARKGLENWAPSRPRRRSFVSASSTTARGRTWKGGPRRAWKIRRWKLSDILNFSTPADNARHGLSSCPAKGRTGRSGAVLLDRRRRFTRVARSWRPPVSAWMEGRTMGFEQAVVYALKDGRDTG
jgi:Domain of unknown function (DUF4432)